MSPYQTWSNILLKNITIVSPEGSPGLIMGNASNPIKYLAFEDVVVTSQVFIGKKPFGDSYYREPCGAIIISLAKGKTFPIPHPVFNL